jgi:hypothetical protein
MRRIVCASVALACGATLWLGGVSAQEREDRTLLPWEQLHAIIDEASGERAMHHLLELVPYPRVRSRAEYEGHFRENEVMAKFAKDYGYANVEIESFPVPQPLWQGWTGELWLTAPETRKLYDIHDVAISLAPNSDSGEVTADVIDVGVGARPEDYAGKDVKGKVVLGSATATALQRLGVFERGAVGVISWNALRPESFPDAILSASIAAAPKDKTAGFGWIVSARTGRELVDTLGKGQKVTIKSIVKAETFPGELETVHATIPGDGSTDQEIIFSAHLHEGYIKQGANDDSSGCAVTLEMGRTYIRLVKEGKLPKPKRTIHFLWVPEISGTNAWLNKHPETAKKLIADLNFDMEGLGLTKSGSRWVMHRTPDTFPTYLNDVGASVLEWVAAVNEERVRFRDNGYKFTLPILSPNGSRDPFYAVVEKHYGSSDHTMYMTHGIAALTFATWPDMWYHSSQDTPDKLDSTQFRRVAVVGTSVMSVMASADDAGALRVAGESLSRGTERMGESQRKGLGYMADAPDAAALGVAYMEAKNAIAHQQKIERAVVDSAKVLFTAPADGEKKLAGLGTLVDQRAVALQNETAAYYKLQADRFKVKPAEPVLTAAETEAAGLIAERVQGGQMFGRRGRNDALFATLPPAERAAMNDAMNKLPQHMGAELNTLLTQKKTVLEIRNFLAGEFDPLPAEDLLAYLRATEKLGGVKLTPKPADAKPGATAAKAKKK